MAAAFLALFVACLDGERVRGNTPAQGAPAPLVSAEGFLRRIFADLHGLVPERTSVAFAERLSALEQGRMSRESRRDAVERLLEASGYARAFVEERAESLLGLGGGVEGTYRFLSSYIDELIAMTAASAERTALEAYRRDLDDELERLRALPARLAAREIDETVVLHTLATSTAAAVLAGPDAQARALFRELVGREPGVFELRQAGAMAQPAQFVGGDDAPAVGIVLRQEGAHLGDLARILIASDAFVGARVSHAFQRYLGRAPKPAEVWPALDALRDARRAGTFAAAYRALLVTLLSSDEYARP
jgi:hypothetical protein